MKKKRTFSTDNLSDLHEQITGMADTREKASLLLLYTDHLIRKFRYAEAYSRCREALDISERLGFQPGLMEGHHLVGVIQYQTGFYKNALDEYYTALQIAEAIARTDYALHIRINIGTIYSDTEDFDRAREIFLECLQSVRNMDKPDLLASIMNNLGVLYLRRREFDVAMKYFNDLKTMKEGEKDSDALKMIFHNIGLIMMEKEEYDHALKNFQSSLQLSRQSSDGPGIIQNLIALGQLNFRKNEMDHAIDLLLQAEEKGKQLQMGRELSRIYNLLIRIHKTKQDWESVIRYLENLRENEDAIHREQIDRCKSNLLLQHELNRKKEQLNRSHAENVELERLNRELDRMMAKSLESENTLRLLWNSIQTGVVIIDSRNHRIVDVNRKAAELFGTEHDDIIGRKCHQFICPAHEGRCPITDLCETFNNSEKTLIRKNGAELPILKTVVPITMNNREHLLECFMDISDQKRREFTIRTMNETLQRKTEALMEANRAMDESLRILRETQSRLVQAEKMAALGELVAGVAHEINTPVGVGITAASHLQSIQENLREQFRTKQLTPDSLRAMIDDGNECAGIILANLKRAADLIHSFKQVAVDQTTEEYRRIDLRKYLDEILMNLHPQLKKTDHSITVTCPDDLEIHTIPGYLSQIITNLVINSIKHGFAEMKSGNIAINASVEDDHLVLEYTDNGRGMPPEHAEKIFDPFFTTARGQGGTGLGMHLVYSIVTQKMQGEVDCVTAPGEGIRFGFRIPLPAP